MGKRCPNCNAQITIKDINKSKTAEVIKCSSCRRNLVESGVSKIIILLVVLFPSFFVMNNVENFWLRGIIIFGWAFAVNVMIRPLITKYKLEEKK